MIKARHNPFFVEFFRFYSKFMLHQHFRKVIIKGGYTERNLPLLMVANHFSWWDGFIANYLNNTMFKRKFHVMMLEEQLKQRMFLNKAGVFSIKKKTRDVVDSLNYTKELLTNPQNMVVIYPQGEIESLYHYPLQFEKGISSVMGKMQPENIQVVFLATLVDYFSHRKPTLTLALADYNAEQFASIKNMEDAYNQHLKNMIEQQKPDMQ
ncbi:MAG: lysophospholipid acyltransferase family protein [Bacteroidota bacterium]